MIPRAPGLRFALLGAVLFAAVRAAAPAALAPSPAPSVDRAGLDLVDRALLVGVDHSATARARLVALGRELRLADDDDPVALERQARALGLTRSDPVLRRHLGDLFSLAAAAVPSTDLPDEATLRTYHAQHVATWTIPARVRFTHIYLSRGQRGAAVQRDAAEALAGLRARGVSAADAAGRGDPFARGARVGPLDDAAVAALFGPTFASQLRTLPTEQWAGPLASAYGLHLVWVEAPLPATATPFEGVRAQVLHAWLRERSATRAVP